MVGHKNFVDTRGGQEPYSRPLVPIKPHVAFMKTSGCLSRTRSYCQILTFGTVMDGHTNFAETRGGHEFSN